MDALADEVKTELTGLEQDPDLVAVAGFFEGSTTVASAGALSPAQSTEPVELPRGVLAWSPDTGYKPDEAATPPSPYDLQVVGNPRDAGAELLVDWDAGSDTTQLTVGTTTIELPTDASAVARVDGDTVVEATFAASWELVAETRCGATARSLTATSLELEVTAGSRSLTVSATTTAASTSLSVELALGGIGAEVGFTIDEQIRILAEPCPTELPLGGAIGTPSSVGLDLGVSSADHSVALSAQATDMVWNMLNAPPTLATFDLSGSLAVDGSVAGTLEGSFDETASPPFDGRVRFDDRTMTVDEIVDEIAGTEP